MAKKLTVQQGSEKPTNGAAYVDAATGRSPEFTRMPLREGDARIRQVNVDVFDLARLVPTIKMVKFGVDPATGEALYHPVRAVSVGARLEMVALQDRLETSVEQGEAAQVSAGLAIVYFMLPSLPAGTAEDMPIGALTALLGFLMDEMNRQTREVSDAAKNVLGARGENSESPA